MLISRRWLQKFFDVELPAGDALAEALTFHAFEIESVEKVGDDEVLDVKVTPNRGHDCLSHRGIAKEISAILSLPITKDPFQDDPALTLVTDKIHVKVADEKLCRRYIAAYVRGIKVGPSPKWLVERLLALGQRSVNNVVDATNFVMFNTGQPLHAFDAGKLSAAGGTFSIAVRPARDGEKLIALDGKEYALRTADLLIVDGNADLPIGIAGVKGGMPAGITEETVDIIIESANFDGVSVRRSAASLKLRTDASARFEQNMSPEIAAWGMRGVVDLILKIAGGECDGFVDVYPDKQKNAPVSVGVAHVNATLGSDFSKEQIGNAFLRLGLPFEEKDGVFSVLPPAERLDLQLPEDLVEEVGRIIGYDHIQAALLPAGATTVALDKIFYAQEKIREFLVERGFSEVYTSVFSKEGKRAVLNNVSSDRPYLRSTLTPELSAALLCNVQNKELLGLAQVRLFEIGTVWDPEEKFELGIAVERVKREGTAVDALRALLKELTQSDAGAKEQDGEVITVPLSALLQKMPEPDHYDDLPRVGDVRYKPFSKYPYIVRDVAFWVDGEPDEKELLEKIRSSAGPLLMRVSLFDRFAKEGRTSLAFRLIFQSYERTLEDKEAHESMEKVYETLRALGAEIR